MARRPDVAARGHEEMTPCSLLRRTCLLVCMAAVLAPKSPLEAFEILGHKWATRQVPLWINPSFPDRELSGTREQQIELLRGAAATWRTQSAADFEFVYRGTTEASGFQRRDGLNTISWVDEDNFEALAATILDYEFGEITGFDVVYFGQTAGIENRWNGPQDPISRTYDIAGVAVHELGHALGLDHSEVEDATMYFSARLRGLPLRTLHVDDRRGIEFLYGVRGEVDFSPTLFTVEPAIGPTLGGNEVVIRGSNFSWTSDTELRFGQVTIPRHSYSVESLGVLRIRSVVAHPEGQADITLSNELGTVTAARAYEFESMPDFFVRGDADSNGELELTDAIFHLDALFRGGPASSCADAADANDDGLLDLSDSVYSLWFLFIGGPAPPPPFPEPGTDPTEDELGC